MSCVDEVSRIISDYFDSHLEHIDVICSYDFYYDFEQKTLGWALLCSPKRDEIFDNFFENDLGCREFNNFIYSIFHEYGHHMTLKFFNELEWDEYLNNCERLNRDAFSEARERAYFYLPVEMVASKWAVKYINSHYEELKKWWEKVLGPAFVNMYGHDKEIQELARQLMCEEEN